MKKFIISFLILFLGIFFTCNKSFAVGDYGPNWVKDVIKVYIPEDGTYYAQMQQAFETWSGKSFGQLKFEYVTNEPDSDIEVIFADKTDGTDGDIGSYALTIKGGVITKAQITLAPKPRQSEKLIFNVMLHEIGHALGLRDSSRKLGIMYSNVSEEQKLINNDIIKLYRLNGWSYMNKGTYSSF